MVSFAKEPRFDRALLQIKHRTKRARPSGVRSDLKEHYTNIKILLVCLAKEPCFDRALLQKSPTNISFFCKRFLPKQGSFAEERLQIQSF